ncbi:MAG: hypothetical protein AAGA77_25310 [Bacteroidota bacterium]
MKNLIYLILPALLLVVTSCSDKAELEENNAEFKFQKELTISDEDGNYADIVVHANSEELLSDYTREAFTLETTTQTFTQSNNLADVEFEESAEDDEVEEGEVFVLVTNYNLDPSITGFSVRYKFDALLNEGITTRATTSYTSYGSSGTNGAYAAYTAQTCNKEYLKVSLKKKNSSISLFWNTLGSTELHSVGDNWSWSSTTTYHKYKLKFVSKESCGGTIGIWYYWLT